MCPVLCIFALIALFASKALRKESKPEKLTPCSFFERMTTNFVSVSNFYLSKKLPILGVIVQIFAFLSLSYFIMLVSKEISYL